ncbi:MAG: hypothetical protein NT164_00905 [Verrucomicrobiae bacterium]|nr:hypothetical protein [Verrucomicrobiae bacterium]
MPLTSLFLLAATLFAGNTNENTALTNAPVAYVASSKQGESERSSESELKWSEIFGWSNTSSGAMPLSAEQPPQEILSPYLARPVVPHTITEN